MVSSDHWKPKVELVLIVSREQIAILDEAQRTQCMHHCRRDLSGVNIGAHSEHFKGPP